MNLVLFEMREGGGFFCKYFQGWWGPMPPTSPPSFSPLAQSWLLPPLGLSYPGCFPLWKHVMLLI